MIRSISIALLSSLSVGLAACGNNAPSAVPRMEATPAENPSDPWATYANPEWDHEAPAVHKTDSGLEYVVLAAGEACASGPTDGDLAFVHYEGRLLDGTVFDSSLARGEAISFPANRVISGWTEALGLMCPGDDWMVYLPSDIAYGDSPRPGGAIKPGDDLVFRVILMADIDEADWSGENFR